MRRSRVIEWRAYRFQQPFAMTQRNAEIGEVLFDQIRQDLQIDRACVVAPVLRRYPLAEGVEVIPLAELPEWLDT